MTRREKQRELFIELINYQLKDHGVTYNDVRDNQTWYMDFTTTPEKESEFIRYCTTRIADVLKVGRKQAEEEANWFILQWGLTTIDKSNQERKEERKSKKDKDIL